MPTGWYNVKGLKTLRAKWKTFSDECALIVLEGVFGAQDVEKLVVFLRLLQSEGYEIYVEPRQMQIADAVGTAFSTFVPFVTSGQLSPIRICTGVQRKLRMFPKSVPSVDKEHRLKQLG